MAVDTRSIRLERDDLRRQLTASQAALAALREKVNARLSKYTRTPEQKLKVAEQFFDREAERSRKLKVAKSDKNRKAVLRLVKVSEPLMHIL